MQEAKTMKQDNVRMLLTEILGTLRKQAATKEEWWIAEDIANHLRVSKNTAQARYITDDTFPQPHLMPGGGKRWLADEVRAWAKRRPRVSR